MSSSLKDLQCIAVRTEEDCSETTGRDATHPQNRQAAELLQRYFQVSPKLLGFGEAWCLESAMLWRGIRDFTKFGNKRVSDLDML